MSDADGLLLNLGCGMRVHPAWQNFDLQPLREGVMKLDVRGPLPFADGSARVVYHSHVLEHLDRVTAERFLRECRRVLRADGVLRVVVPDLEGICRAYLGAIDRVDAGRAEATDEHGWMQLELLDQCVRTVSGGEMLKWWVEPNVRAAGFVETRMGREFRDFRQQFEAQVRATGRRPEWIDRLPRVDTPEGEVRFRSGGEIHRWMYDRISLGALLKSVGFAQTKVCGARESAIGGWAGYELDTDEKGAARKPDSLYMEGSLQSFPA